MGLLDSVLGSLLSGGQQQQGGGGALGGALGNVLGGMLGGGGQQAGAANSPLASILGSLLANNGPAGGLGGLMEAFQRNGQGDVLGSWIGSGQNAPISPDALGKVLGPDVLSKLGAQAGGVPQGDLLGSLAQILPGVIDKMTPQGQAPQGGFGDLGSILGALTGKS
jgi:uncharacterized protein YidB (DUF937 family)